MNDAGGGAARSMFHPPHLGELIRESMDEVGWNVAETAARLECERGTLSRVLNGKAGVSVKMALALESLGWGTADHWMRMQASCIVSCLKQFGADSLEGGGGVSGIDVEPAARDLVNDIEHHPHAFVLACVADRQTKADIAWSLPHLPHEATGGFDVDTLLEPRKDTWTSHSDPVRQAFPVWCVARGPHRVPHDVSLAASRRKEEPNGGSSISSSPVLCRGATAVRGGGRAPATEPLAGRVLRPLRTGRALGQERRRSIS